MIKNPDNALFLPLSKSLIHFKLKDFNGDEAISNEYSSFKTCALSYSGYHCSCYGINSPCCICGSYLMEGYYCI